MGWTSLLVCAETIKRWMKQDHPDLPEKLFDPIATDRRRESPDGVKRYIEIPARGWHEGYLTVFSKRQHVESG